MREFIAATGSSGKTNLNDTKVAILSINVKKCLIYSRKTIHLKIKKKTTAKGKHFLPSNTCYINV